MKTVEIALALGNIYQNSGCGKILIPRNGAIARFKSLIAKIPYNGSSLLVCTAGYSKRYPREPKYGSNLSLSAQLARFLREDHNPWYKRLLIKPICWGTRKEIRMGIKVAQHFGFANKDEEVTLVIASNLFHLPRVWMISKFYTPKKWKIKLVRAHHSFSIFDHLLEAPKILHDGWYVFRVTRRLRRRTLQRMKSDYETTMIQVRRK